MPTKLRLAAVAIGLFCAPRSRAQQPAAASPVFEVASVRPCKDSEAGGRRGDPSQNTPGRLTLRCQNVMGFISLAYQFYANGRVNAPWSWPPIEGGPGWISSGRYEINAKAEGAPPEAITHGPHAASASRRPVQAQDPSRDKGDPGLRAHRGQERPETAAVQGRKLHSLRFRDGFASAGA